MEVLFTLCRGLAANHWIAFRVYILGLVDHSSILAQFINPSRRKRLVVYVLPQVYKFNFHNVLSTLTK